MQRLNTMDDMSTQTPKFEHHYQGPKGTYDIHLDGRGERLTMVFDGEGTLEGTRDLVKALDNVRALLNVSDRVIAVADLRGLRGAPLRAQLLLGKWLLANKGRVSRIAVFGGRPIEMKLARAVMKMARMKSVGFFDGENQAEEWLSREE